MAHKKVKRIIDKVVIEGRWECPKCGKKNLGRTKKCVCSYPRTFKDAFYYPDQNAVTDPALLELANSGPEAYCESCGVAISGTATQCDSCGATKSDMAVQREKVVLTELPETQEEAQAHFHDPRVDTYSPSMKPKVSASSKKFSLNQWHFYIAGILALIFIGYLLLRTYEVKAQMVGAEWNRTIFIEQYKTVQEDGWSIPTGGRLRYTNSEIHHYDRVKVGEETIEGSCHTITTEDGNGFASVETVCEDDRTENIYEDRPVYATKYYYDIDRWVAFREVESSGIQSAEIPPYWGEFELNCAGQTRIGCERESHRSEEYIIVFRDNENPEKIYRHSVSQSDWWLYLVEREYTLVVNAFGIQNDPLRHGQPEGQINYGESQSTNP